MTLVMRGRLSKKVVCTTLLRSSSWLLLPWKSLSDLLMRAHARAGCCCGSIIGMAAALHLQSVDDATIAEVPSSVRLHGRLALP